jgi:predicted membrane-bound spermidine synthase
MNLRSVHATLIVLSAALAVLFGVWSVAQYQRGNGTVNLIVAIAAFAASLGLVAYDSWFLRKTRIWR